MSSGFVSSGTTEEAWQKAREAIEATRKRKADESQQANSKSLYEVLQQNNAAKQEAFEESIRLKNQFRTLDDDEVDFLDSVLESTRAKELAVKKETNEQLEAFRRQQETVDKSLLLGEEDPKNSDAQVNSETVEWGAATRKRKRPRENNLLKAVKLSKSSDPVKATSENISVGTGSSTSTSTPSKVPQGSQKATSKSTNELVATAPSSKAAPVQTSKGTSSKPGGLLGLGAYDSDDED